MIGAESLVRTLLASGVDTCFANPGTSEMHFVAALDRAPGMRCVLGLFEGVVAGAADGYARMTGKAAVTLFHCGPGLGNGIAYLHNAKRAQSPIVNVVGDQATYHAPLDPPLASDVEGLARPVSQWVKKVTRVEDLGSGAAEAVQAAYAPPGGNATLILPSDVSWNDGGVPAAPLPKPKRASVDSAAIAEAARVLRSGEPAVLMLAGPGVQDDGLKVAHRIGAATGARIMCQTFNARIARGRGRPVIEIVPYPVDDAVDLLKGVKHVVGAGTGLPVAFFAYPGKPGIMTPKDTALHVLARPDQDVKGALDRLADELGCPDVPLPEHRSNAIPGDGPVTVEGAGATLAALVPDDTIIVDEGITLRGPFFQATKHAARHDWLQVPGGAIGGGLPLATGAAIGAPGRRVIALQADGSAMYTVQALWTQARENLDVTTVLLSNRKYAILVHELKQVGAVAGKTARDLFELDRPEIDWLSMARSMGVEAARADTLSRFADLLTHANGRRGPFLIELRL
jgi:acetolactate synthase I/II/III large subunit